VQVLVYRRGLASWDRLAEDRAGFAGEAAGEAQPREEPRPVERRRFDPRAVTLAAAVAFALLLATTAWALVGAVAAWLALAWLVAKPDRAALPAGLLFAALLAGGAFAFGLGGGLGLDVAARRASRAALLVLTATWLRGSAGAEGLREVSRRVLGRLRRLPAAPEAALVLDQIASEGRLAAAARTLEQRLAGVQKRPVPFIDAVLGWVVHEAGAVRPRAQRAPLRLRARPLDGGLLIAALLPVLAL
jgi:hypothetical protein